MPKLKAYTLGVNGLLSTHVRELLGAPSHVRQGSIVIVATSKREARDVGTARGFCITLTDPEFRVADGWPIADTLRGFSTQPTLYALTLNLHAGAPVAEVSGLDDAHIVGRLIDSRTIEFEES